MIFKYPLSLNYWEMQVFIKGEKDGQLNNFISSKVLEAEILCAPFHTS